MNLAVLFIISLHENVGEAEQYFLNRSDMTDLSNGARCADYMFA